MITASQSVLWTLLWAASKMVAIAALTPNAEAQFVLTINVLAIAQLELLMKNLKTTATAAQTVNASQPYAVTTLVLPTVLQLIPAVSITSCALALQTQNAKLVCVTQLLESVILTALLLLPQLIYSLLIVCAHRMLNVCLDTALQRMDANLIAQF